MKEKIPSPPADVRNNPAAIQALYQQHVVPSYGRFDLVFSHGQGSYLFDIAGKRYLDLGGGIAVCCLGHAHPAITEALTQQSRKLVHVSNLYYTEPQGRLAAELVKRGFALLVLTQKDFRGWSGEDGEKLLKAFRDEAEAAEAGMGAMFG